MKTFEQFLIELRIKDKPSTFKDMILVKDKEHLLQLIKDKADMRELDVSEVTDMNRLFYKNEEFDNKGKWDISGWDIREVAIMSEMFGVCTSLTSVSLPNTEKVENMEYMFDGCTSLESVSLPHTENVKKMGFMFNGCTSLSSVSLPHTESVRDMDGMFDGCISLKSISLPNTESVEYMGWMFEGCKNLYQDLSYFKEITNPNDKQGGEYDMFKGCTKMFQNTDFFPKGYLK